MVSPSNTSNVLIASSRVVRITKPATVATLTLFDSSSADDHDATVVVVEDVLVISSNTACAITPPARPGMAFPLDVGSTTANFTFSPSPSSVTFSVEMVEYSVFLATSVPAFGQDPAVKIVPGPSGNFTARVSLLIANTSYSISIAGYNSQVGLPCILASGCAPRSVMTITGMLVLVRV
jgi:hypothetical protein